MATEEKVHLAPEGAAVTCCGKLFQNCTFKFLEAVKFLLFNGQLGFLLTMWSSFACQLQSTYKDLSSVDLDLPEGLLVGLGCAATSPDSPLDFRQAQNAAERSGVASHPMLCSRLGDTWQIGTTSIQEDHLIASGLRFVHWCHASPNVDARNNPSNDPTVRVYQHLEDKQSRSRHR